jgi:hypothetical protein
LPLFIVFGLITEGRFALDSALLVFSLISVGVRRSHP